jgi:ATP-dependent DNA helicase RecQ
VTIEQALSSLGYSSLRPGQREIIEASLSGRDVLGVMPTGGGKSLCYVLPAVVRPGLTVAISPLIALMMDQVEGLRRRGVRAEMLTYHTTRGQASGIIAAASRDLQLLYVSPERAAKHDFREMIRRSGRLRAVVIDEAHCVLQWGGEFRPEYLQIKSLRESFGAVRYSAYTATATPSGRDEISAALGLRDPFRLVASFDRVNIRYVVAPKLFRLESDMNDILHHIGSGPGIIYRATRYSVEDTCRCLGYTNIDALPYHAGLDGRVRNRNQAAFLSGRTRVIVATIAFGMGIDKPDVRWVLHADLPQSIEAYYQESGRAGRDGKPATATLLWSYRDIPIVRRMIDSVRSPAMRERNRAQFESVIQYATSTTCRRAVLLRYFGQKVDGDCEVCGNCDVCGD